MGAAEAENKRVPGWSTEPGNVPHKVRITKGFYMGAHPVTVGQFQKFIEGSRYKPTHGNSWLNPGTEQGPNYPVVGVTWIDAEAFCRWLSMKDGRTYRLPTEAEWEYACRAGSQTAFSFGDDPKDMAKHGWSKENSGGKRHPVGQLLPNRWGLHDMHGNVYQWVADWYDPDYYRTSPPADPTGPLSGKVRPGSKDAAGKVIAGANTIIRPGHAAARRSRCGPRNTPRSEPASACCSLRNRAGLDL